jgi:hypothetical protein
MEGNGKYPIGCTILAFSLCGVAIRLVKEKKKEQSAWGYNWATLFLGGINVDI